MQQNCFNSTPHLQAFTERVHSVFTLVKRKFLCNSWLCESATVRQISLKGDNTSVLCFSFFRFFPFWLTSILVFNLKCSWLTFNQLANTIVMVMRDSYMCANNLANVIREILQKKLSNHNSSITHTVDMGLPIQYAIVAAMQCETHTVIECFPPPHFFPSIMLFYASSWQIKTSMLQVPIKEAECLKKILRQNIVRVWRS